MTPFSIRVPGKVLLTGEYAVLEGTDAIVAAVDRWVTCGVEASDANVVRGMGLEWREGGGEEPTLGFAVESLRTARRYLEGRGISVPPAAFSIQDDLRAPDGQKLGLGGSACVCVAVVRSVLRLASMSSQGESAERLRFREGSLEDLTFKLAAISHVTVQKKVGSCVDVAASAFGGLIRTRRFDFSPFDGLAAGSPRDFAQAVDASLPHPVERLPVPGPLLLLFGGKSASTPVHVAAVREAALAHPSEWSVFLSESAAATAALSDALRRNDVEKSMAAVERAFQALDAFTPFTGLDITPATHRRFREKARAAGAVAKPSGAGGGDAAFALGPRHVLESLGASLASQGQTAFIAPIVQATP